MIQMDIFPVNVIRCDPSDLNTADCKQICTADDGADYVVKEVATHPMLPASEWFCYHLAGAVRINTPVCKRLVMPDGSIAFGSRWEGGVYELSDPAAFQKIVSNQVPVKDLANRLSAIYAFDLFVNNDDRHVRNYLFRQSRHDLIVLAFDFSRAWLYHGWPLPEPPLPSGSKTRHSFAYIRKYQGFDVPSAIQVLDMLKAISTSTINEILVSMPETWLSQERQRDILSWWDDHRRQDRINKLHGGLANGAYL